MDLITTKFLSLKTLQPKRFYKKLDGWLLGSGKPMRVKSHNNNLWVKLDKTEPWIILQIQPNRQYFQLLCPWCSCREDVLYYYQDFRCRTCTSHVLPPKKTIVGKYRAKNQSSIGDYSMLASTSEDRIAMRLQLEAEGVLYTILIPVLEKDAIDMIRYERCIEPKIMIEPLKQGSIIWSGNKYIWVDGHRSSVITRDGGCVPSMEKLRKQSR